MKKSKSQLLSEAMLALEFYANAWQFEVKTLYGSPEYNGGHIRPVFLQRLLPVAASPFIAFL